MDELHALEALGLELPTWPYTIGVLLFSIAGIAAYRHGRNTGYPIRNG
ncbi:MAG: hypothetical protein V4443_04480 [Pseudomonadota bacterium]